MPAQGTALTDTSLSAPTRVAGVCKRALSSSHSIMGNFRIVKHSISLAVGQHNKVWQVASMIPERALSSWVDSSQYHSWRSNDRMSKIRMKKGGGSLPQ